MQFVIEDKVSQKVNTIPGCTAVERKFHLDKSYNRSKGKLMTEILHFNRFPALKFKYLPKAIVPNDT
jgi:hypothetical protein